jgi:subtilase family serine protease
MAGCLGAVSLSAAAPPSRISESLQSGRTFQLTGNTRPLAAVLPDKGAAAEETPLPRVTIHFQISATQQTALKKLLADQQNPASPKYHKWLTPEQYGEQFGMSENDLSKVQKWARDMGFTNVQVARSKNSISMAGPIGLAEYAFQTPIHNFDRSGILHYANTSDPMLPSALQGIVASVRGLSDLHPRPHSRPRPRFSAGTAGNFIAPADFTTIYDLQPLYNSGIDGTGQKIAIAGQTDIQTFDIEAFQTAAGLPVKAPSVVVDGVDPGLSADDLSEAELDVEWAGAVAPGATIVYVNSSDAFTSATYAIQNQVANVLSLTYGGCEAQTGMDEMNTLSDLFQQANAEGMTVMAASGDSGAADCDYSSDPNHLDTSATNGLAVDFPASSPYVTGMGGTEFNEGTGSYWAASNNASGGSALSYIPEMAWNDDCPPGVTSGSECTGTAANGLSASGGGPSSVYTKPTWQVGTGVPADGARDVPDVSLSASPAHDAYLICETPPTNHVPATTSSCTNGFVDTDGTFSGIGGTSVASPSFAGIVALIDQITGSAQGNINPRLYTLGSVAPDVFHDVTLGSNMVPCTAGSPDCTNGILGYSTSVGYDLVTGLGSVDANSLVQSFGPSYTLSVSPSTLTVGSASSATATVTATAVGGFSGAVSFSCSVPSTLTNTTCSIPGSVTGTGNATLTISNGNSAVLAPKYWWPVPPGGNLQFLSWIAALSIIATLAARKRGLLPGGMTVLAALVMTGCGGGSNTTSLSQTPPSVTGTVTITATSTGTALVSSITKTITVSVTEP